MRICVFEEKGCLALQLIIYITCMSKLIYMNYGITALILRSFIGVIYEKKIIRSHIIDSRIPVNNLKALRNDSFLEGSQTHKFSNISHKNSVIP